MLDTILEMQMTEGAPQSDDWKALDLDSTVWDSLKAHRLQSVLAPWACQYSSLGRIRNEARVIYHMEALREKVCLDTFHRVQLEARRQGINLVGLKGIVLAQELYPFKGQRQFRDIDVWVSPDQLNGAIKAFEEDGFEICAPPQTENLRNPQAKGSSIEAAKFGLEAVTLQKEDVAIEIHTVILPPELADYPIGLNNENSQLRSEDMLAHLFFHASRHHFNVGFRHVLDIGLWVRNKSVDFNALEDKLLRSGSFEIAYPAWMIAHWLLPNQVPGPKTKKLSALTRLYTRQCYRHFFCMPEISKGLLGTPLIFYFKKRSSEKNSAFAGIEQKKLNYQLGAKSSACKRLCWKGLRPFLLLYRHFTPAFNLGRLLFGLSRGGKVPPPENFEFGRVVRKESTRPIDEER